MFNPDPLVGIFKPDVVCKLLVPLLLTLANLYSSDNLSSPVFNLGATSSPTGDDTGAGTGGGVGTGATFGLPKHIYNISYVMFNPEF